MNRTFVIKDAFRVPDGTLLSPFLNPKDSTSGLPFDLFDDFSIAAGEIEPGLTSRIHVMPHVTQVTFVRRGRLTVRMRESSGKATYEIDLKTDEAVLTKQGTFFQLMNRGESSCHVLYIVSPAYLFEIDDSQNAIYDDSVVLDEDWAELEKLSWNPPALQADSTSLAAREEAMARLAAKHPTAIAS